MPLGYDWTYDNANIIDPPLDALLGTAADLQAWISTNRSGLLGGFDSVPVPPIQSVFDGNWQHMAGGYDLLQVIAQYPAGSVNMTGVPTVVDRSGKTIPAIGAFVGRPAVVDPSKPLIIALHGHEAPHRGEPPVRLWLDHWWPEELCKAGYVVITPSHLPYAHFPNLYTSWDYAIVWTRFAWDIVNACLGTPAGFPEHTGLVACGLSSGGIGASFMTAWRPEISRGVFAGSLLSLEFARQNYRIAGLPNSWDMRKVYSYLPYYLYFANRHVQFQLGRVDSFFPDHTAWVSDGASFLGTDRDMMSSEIMGEYLPTRDAAQKLGGKADLLIHDGGHIFKSDAALSFLAE
jgi:hypothetical protein